QVAQPNFIEHSQLVRHLGSIREMVHCLSHRHIENFVNIFTPIPDLEHFRLKSLALALLANQFHVRKKLHFDNYRPTALAGFAAPSRNIERKMSSGMSALVRLRCTRKQITDAIKRL